MTNQMDEMIDRLHDAEARLSATLDKVDDAIARQPSRLPGWSVGHLLTHLARNADSVVRRLDGAARDEVMDQYAGGVAGRAAEIEAGAGRDADTLVADVRSSAAAAEASARGLPEEAWGRMCRGPHGHEHTATQVVTGRLREVELHHVDLGLGYEPADWPDDFVADQLAAALKAAPGLAAPADLLAWLSGRGPAPELQDWP